MLPSDPLDIATIGKARGLLDNASSATAHGDHKDAIGYARQALDLLGKEVVRVTHTGPAGVGVTRVADPLVAARERLGVWVTAEPGRSWDDGDGFVGLYLDADNWHRAPDHVGKGHDRASAILAALDAANSDDQTRKSDG